MTTTTDYALRGVTDVVFTRPVLALLRNDAASLRDGAEAVVAAMRARDEHQTGAYGPECRFPNGDCAADVLRLCRAVQASDWASVVDVSPLADFVAPLATTSWRDVGPHCDLETVHDLSSGMHLVPTFRYTEEQQVAVVRFLAVLHLATSGVLTVASYGVGGPEVLGCPDCIWGNDVQSLAGRVKDAGRTVGLAVRDGVTDSRHARRVFPPGWYLGKRVPDTREREANLSWSFPDTTSRDEAGRVLRCNGFAVAKQGNRIEATRGLESQFDVCDSNRWGHALFRRATYLGACQTFR